MVTFISGLTALSYETRNQRGLTTFGRIILSALILGTACSSGGVVLDWLVKQADDAKTEKQLDRLRLAADAARFTTADATVTITMSIDKSLLALGGPVAKLDRALKYAKSNCRMPGGVAQCNDYLIRALVLDELRFTKKSSLFPSPNSDKRAFGIMGTLGVWVRFYDSEFKPSLNLDKDVVGSFILNEILISGTTLFEIDRISLEAVYRRQDTDRSAAGKGSARRLCCRRKGRP